MTFIENDGSVRQGRVYFERNDSGLIGQIRTSYAALVALFGETDQRDGERRPDVFRGWSIRTWHGDVTVYDFHADVAREYDGYWHHEHPDDERLYSVGGWREHGSNAFALVVLALARAGHPVKVERYP